MVFTTTDRFTLLGRVWEKAKTPDYRGGAIGCLKHMETFPGDYLLAHRGNVLPVEASQFLRAILEQGCATLK